MLRAMHTDESGERVNRRETQVASDAAAAPFLLQILEEGTHQRWREVVNRQAIHRRLADFVQVWKQEDERIAITDLRITSQIAVSDKVLQQKTTDPRADHGLVTHGAPPVEHSARSADWPHAAIPL